MKRNTKSSKKSVYVAYSSSNNDIVAVTRTVREMEEVLGAGNNTLNYNIKNNTLRKLSNHTSVYIKKLDVSAYV